MPALKLLVLCGKNLRRSPTAALLYQQDPRVDIRSAGLSPESRRRVSMKDVEWAEQIAVMERKHRSRLLEAIPAAAERPIAVLDIPDDYDFNQPELVELLTQSIEPLLQAHES